jgi:hypothetical protein
MANQSPAVKHHFWILFALAPLFVGLAFLLMLVMVSGDIAAKQKEFKDVKDALGTANPKTNGDLKAISNELGVQEKNRTILWGQSYQEQLDAGVFAWPESRHQPFNALAKRGMKFGDNFYTQERVTDPEVLKPTFASAYKKVGESIAPTRFAGGSYLTALRSVSETGWGTKPVDPAPFWLALEDYWVQRGLLDPIVKLNAAAALFEDVTPKGAKAGEGKQTFRTRTWELDLEVAQEKNKLLLKGQLRNRTTRLQALGVNKAMKVNVWFREVPADTKPADLPPPDVVFEIRGESVPGKGSLTCTPQEIGVNSPTRITRASQVFDEATVPVRLVNTLELNMLDHRNKATALELPKHIEADEAANPQPEAPADGGRPGIPGGVPGGNPLGSASGSAGGGMGEGGEGGAMGGYDLSSVSGNKHGTYQAVLLGNKKRYVKRTDDVRRMPVGVAVVMDLDYTNDLMVAYTNSPLHFQITQTQWARYKGTLPGVRGAGSTGTTGGGIGGLPGGAAPGGSPDGGEGTGLGPGSGYPGGQPQLPGGGVTGGAGAGPGLAGGGSLTNTSTAGALPGEANANLCEFVLFGIVSLYEQVPADTKKKDENADPMTDPTTDPKQPDPMGEKVKPDPTTKPDPMKPQDPEKKEPAPAPAPTPADDKKKDEAPSQPNK